VGPPTGLWARDALGPHLCKNRAVLARLLMLITVVTTIAIAAPAYADPASDEDANFLTQLKAEGITFQDPGAAISAAKDVCALVDQGTPDTDIVKNLQLRNPGFVGTGAAEFTALAAASYCPKYLTGEDRPPKPPGAVGN
jgi:hypothetical protein